MAEEILGAAIAVPGGINNQKINSMKDFETKHTQGAWFLGDDSDFIFDSNKENANVICRFFERNQDDYKNKEANARLIAASPELIDALCAVLRSYEAACPERYYSDDNVALADDVIKKAIG